MPLAIGRRNAAADGERDAERASVDPYWLSIMAPPARGRDGGVPGSRGSCTAEVGTATPTLHLRTRELQRFNVASHRGGRRWRGEERENRDGQGSEGEGNHREVELAEMVFRHAGDERP